MTTRENPYRSPEPGGDQRRTHWRWVVCALLFFATTVNYVDRQVLSLLEPTLRGEFGWSASHFGLILNSFTLAYAMSYTLAGRLMDRIGERKGFLLAVALWSTAAMAHGLVRPLVNSGLPWLNSTFALHLTPLVLAVAGFSVARFALGLAEGGNFPGAIKTVGLWHPKSERALATGLFNSGSNMGVLLAAGAVPFIVHHMGWDWSAAFYLTGALGFLWLVFWWAWYDRPENHPRVSRAELEYIQKDPPDPPVAIPWLSLLKYRQTWAYTLGMAMTGPFWWFYLYWTPGFLKDRLGVDLGHVFWALLIIYLMADVGAIGGGGLSSWLLHRGASLNVARKTAFLICAVCVVPVALVAHATSVWVAAVLIGLAAAAHQGYSSNLYTIVSDTVPRKAVSSVVGIGGTASCISSILFTALVGFILDWSEQLTGKREYMIPFIIAGSSYLVATGVIHLLLPRLEPMPLENVEQA